MAFLLSLFNKDLIPQEFRKPSYVLPAALLINIFTIMMESVKLSSSVRLVQPYFSLTNDSAIRQNIFVLIVDTPFSNGKSVKMLPSTNAQTIIAPPVLKLCKTSILKNLPYLNKNHLSLSSLTSTANIISRFPLYLIASLKSLSLIFLVLIFL